MDMEELNEIYRDRFLNAFFASYSMIGVLAGIVVAVAAIIRTPSNFWLVDWAGILTIIQVLIILLMFHLFRRIYDLLGFAPKEADADPNHIHHTKAKNYANTAKKVRKVSEFFIHLMILAQMALIVAAWHSPQTEDPNNKGCCEWVSDNEPIRLRP
jgi:hypothetical protein